MVKKILKIVLPLSLAVMLILSFSVFSFAAVQPPLDGTPAGYLVAPLALDTLVFFPSGMNVSVPSPFYQTVTRGYDTPTETHTFVYYRDEPEPTSDIKEYQVAPGAIGLATTNVSQRSYQFSTDIFPGIYADFGLRNSKPFPCNVQLLDAMSYSDFIVPPNSTFDFVLTIRGTKYVSTSPGFYTPEPFYQVITHTYSNPTTASVSHRMFPYLNEYSELVTDSSIDMFVCDLYDIRYMLSTPEGSTAGLLQFDMAFVDTARIPSVDSFVQAYGDTIVEGGDLSNAGFELGNFFRQSVGSFFNAEVFPGVSIGGILAAVFGIILFLAFLKIFAGG